MCDCNQSNILLHIQEIIDNCRCGIDGFFTDSKSAATIILKYLETEQIIVKNKGTFAMDFKEQNKAA